MVQQRPPLERIPGIETPAPDPCRASNISRAPEGSQDAFIVLTVWGCQHVLSALDSVLASQPRGPAAKWGNGCWKTLVVGEKVQHRMSTMAGVGPWVGM